jgi:hypothetical protein
MRQDFDETFEVSHLELLRRAKTYDDQEAWAMFQHGLEETVLSWFHEHPGREAACRIQSERHFVALAFERLRQATLRWPLACETLSEVLVYLLVSLNGTLLEAVRVSSTPVALSYLWPDGEARPDRSRVWDRLQSLLSSERERRLAYLLYHCGLSPAEIVRCYPREWSDVHDVARLRRSIFMCLKHETEFEGTHIHLSKQENIS